MSSTHPYLDSVYLALRGYQRRINACIDREHRHLHLPYGAGKSVLSAIHALNKRLQNPTEFGMAGIIFCRSHNIPTWTQDLYKWFHKVPDFTVTAGDVALAQASSLAPTFLLIPYHRVAPLRIPLARFLSKWRPAALIGDEATKLKNPHTKMFEASFSLSLNSRSLYFDPLALTGRAMPEKYVDIWGQFQYCYPGFNPLGQSYYSFLRKFFVKADFGYALDMDKEDRFRAILRMHMLEISAAEMDDWRAQNPKNDPTYITEYYEASAEQLKLYDQLFNTWSLPSAPVIEENVPEDEKTDTVEDMEFSYTISLLQKAQQIAGGFYYDHDKNPIYLKTQPKLALLQEILQQLLTEQPERKILLWAHYRAERLNLIPALLDQMGIRYVIGPDAEALHAFETPLSSDNPNSPSLILMPTSVSQGFNELASADTSIIYSNVYSQEMRGQLEARNTGFRMQHPVVNIIDLCSQEMWDQEVITALQAKDFTPARANAIIRKRTKKEAPDHV